MAVLVWGVVAFALAFGLGAAPQQAALWGVVGGFGCPLSLLVLYGAMVVIAALREP